MSDIDDLLSEFSQPMATPAPPRGPMDYVPNSATFGTAGQRAVDESVSQMGEGWNQMSQGREAWDRAVGMGKMALGGMRYVSSPLEALGEYFGDPIRKGVTDLTGSEAVGNVIGNTVALAPMMGAPFHMTGPRALVEGTAAAVGEGLPVSNAARFAGKLGGKAAPAAASEIDDVLAQFDAPRTTSRVTSSTQPKTGWAQPEGSLEEKYASYFRGGDPADLPPLANEQPRSIKGPAGQRAPKGEVMFPAYEAGIGRPTFRTSHEPRVPADEPNMRDFEAPFEREFAGQRQVEQFPLHPGNNPRLQEMYLPNAQKLPPTSPFDPMTNTIAELKLRHMGDPRTVEGIKPVPTTQPATPAAPRSEPTKPVTAASLEKDVTRFGDVEVGQNYDIVHSMGGQELRSSGGRVARLVDINEPTVDKGKTVFRPVQYAQFEDGRSVPLKLLRPQGETNLAGPDAAPRAQPAKTSGQVVRPVESGEADPAFADLQSSMAKKAEPKVYNVKDPVAVAKGIQEALGKFKGRASLTQIQEVMPGVTRKTLMRVIDEIQKTKAPNVSYNADSLPNEVFVTRRKMTEAESKGISAAAGESMRDSNFKKGLSNIRSQIKSNVLYLRNLSGQNFEKLGGVNIAPQAIAKRLQKMVDGGEIQIIGEDSGTLFPKVHTGMFDLDSNDEDLLVKFLKKDKPMEIEYRKKK